MHCMLFYVGGKEPRCNFAGRQQGGNVDIAGRCSVRCSWTTLHGSVDRRLGWRGTQVDTGDGGTSEETES